MRADARIDPGDGEALVYAQASTREMAYLLHSCTKSPTRPLIPCSLLNVQTGKDEETGGNESRARSV